MRIRFNLNHNIQFRPNDRTREIVVRFIDQQIEEMVRSGCISSTVAATRQYLEKRFATNPGSDGLVSWQATDFMLAIGQHVYLGAEAPIEDLEIEIEHMTLIMSS